MSTGSFGGGMPQRPQAISDPASVFGKGIMPSYQQVGGQTGGMSPIPRMPQYNQLNAPIDKTTSMPFGAPRGFDMPFGLQGRSSLPQNNPFSQNYGSVAGFGMPQRPQSLAAPKAATAPAQQMPQQQPYLIRPQQPPPPQGPAQQGQAGYQWGQANSINGDGDVGWQPAFGPAAKAYVAQMTNTASGVQPWLPQVNWNDALNSIGQLSGTPFNPAIWGNL